MRFILDSFTQLKPEEKIFFKPFDFDEITRQSSGFFEIVFYFAKDWYKYQIRLNKEKVLSEYLGVIGNNDETVIFSFDAANNKRVYPERDEDLLRFVRPNTTFLSTTAQFNHTFLGEMYRHLKDGIISLGELALFDYTQNMLFDEQIGMGDINRLFDKAGIDHMYGTLIERQTLPKTEKTAIKLITSVMSEQEKVAGQPFDYDNDENSTKEIMFAHKYEKIYMLPFLSESMGTRRFFELAGPLWDCMHHEKNLFIDEIESSLHDDLIEFFICSFVENTKESQLLFTTHNQTLLDSPLLRDDEVWFAQKDTNGGSEFFSLAEFKDVPENVSRRELYKAGAFGALPHTARFFKD
jgi:hypothetical protein